MFRFLRRSPAPSAPMSGLRARVWARTNGRCWYDGVRLDPRAWHIDHVVPRQAGGTNEFVNLVPSCPSCNLRKGCRDLDAFRAAEARRLGHEGLSWRLGLQRHRFYFERVGLRQDAEG